MKEWRTNTGWTDLPSLPFDYDKELVGGRTPCLLGQDKLLPTARELGWRYDASSPGGRQVWPAKKDGIWDLPLQQIPFPGHSFEVLSVDTTSLANQSVNSTKAPAHNYPGWREQADEFVHFGPQAGVRVQPGPFFIGNHFEEWNGGINMDAVENALKHIAREKEKGEDIRPVSFRQYRLAGRADRKCCASSVPSRSGSSRPAAGRPSEGGAGFLRKRRLKCGFPPVRGVRKIPGRTCETFHMSAASRAPCARTAPRRPRPSPRRPGHRVPAPGRAARHRLRLRRRLGRRRQHRLRHRRGLSTVDKGERADAPDLSGETVDGGHVDVDDYKGKVVVLSVWGSWCPPCRAEAKNFGKGLPGRPGPGRPVRRLSTPATRPPVRPAPSRKEVRGQLHRACTTRPAS